MNPILKLGAHLYAQPWSKFYTSQCAHNRCNPLATQFKVTWLLTTLGIFVLIHKFVFLNF
jgi:hypothetical protein